MEKKGSQFNLNSLLNMIAIGAIVWNASTTLKLSEHMTRVETLLEVRGEQQVKNEKRMDAIEAILGVKVKVP